MDDEPRDDGGREDEDRREAPSADDEKASGSREKADGSQGRSGRRKPMSVREAVGPPGLRGQKPRPRKRPAGGRRREADAEVGGGGARPTPVREAMDAPALDEVLADPAELPSRPLEVEGEPWIAREGGRARTGQRGDVGVPLLHLLFYRAEAPERAVKEALVVGRSLEGLDEARLEDAFGESRPVSSHGGSSVSK